MAVDHCQYLEPRPKRTRLDSLDSSKQLDITGVINVLKGYEDYDGGVNCSICGKLYKSKVCFIKHLWEHSVYWDLFEGEKNHDRVLSIQAALILSSGYGFTAGTDVSSLLVTSPHTQDKKKDINGNEVQASPEKAEKKQSSPKKVRSPSKRKRLLSGCT